MLRTLQEARRSDVGISLSRIRQPTLVVRGDREPIVSADWARRLARSLPSGSLVTIPGAPRSVHYSPVGALRGSVRDFPQHGQPVLTPSVTGSGRGRGHPAVAVLAAGAVMLAYPLTEERLRAMVEEIAERRVVRLASLRQRGS
jgi:fermentation-respiration switch protein FrsA (DUF1100 family)